MHSQALVTIYEPKPNTLGIVKTPTKGKNKRPHEEMDDSVSASTVGGWVYIGSANFSKAAWVRIRDHKPQLTFAGQH
jgi:tyrosyl-DNA phosphodiesterase-1